jgi:hypothetical protein
LSNERIGEKVGIFEIVELIPEKSNDGHSLYKGVCQECGFERIARYSDLKRTTHCDHVNVNGEYIVMANWNNQRIRGIFTDMKRRCYSPNNKSYRWYGAKGIKICDEWLNDPKQFEIWSMQNGYSDELTIDRKNSDLNYCPENCRWIPKVDNSKYKSTTSMITVNGETHSGKDWSRILNLSVNTINKYIQKYGIEKTVEFIEKRLKNPELKPKRTKSYYDLYMSNN